MQARNDTDLFVCPITLDELIAIVDERSGLSTEYLRKDQIEAVFTPLQVLWCACVCVLCDLLMDPRCVTVLPCCVCRCVTVWVGLLHRPSWLGRCR